MPDTLAPAVAPPHPVAAPAPAPNETDAKTRAGNYFVSNYPPYAYWRAEAVPEALAALARPPAAVTLHDVCTALDDPIIQCRCLLAEVGCDDERACPAHAFWKPQREQTIAYLRRTTLAELAAFAERRRATATPARRRQPRR